MPEDRGAPETRPGVCNRSFDEALLSGYLDEALTQAQQQRVRVHLEDCPTCATVLAEMRQLREATKTTPFRVPADDQWRESPRGAVSWLSRHLGGGVLALWLLVTAAFALWQAWLGTHGWLERLLVFGGVLGFGLLLLSVLLDRLSQWKTDPYRGVEK